MRVSFIQSYIDWEEAQDNFEQELLTKEIGLTSWGSYFINPPKYSIEFIEIENNEKLNIKGIELLTFHGFSSCRLNYKDGRESVYDLLPFYSMNTKKFYLSLIEIPIYTRKN